MWRSGWLGIYNSESMKTLTEREVQILISFLGDDDPKVVSMAQDQLRTHFQQAGPHLKEALAKAPNELRKKLRSLLQKFHWEVLETEFRELSSRGEKRFDLEDGMFLLARFAWPDLEINQCLRVLDDMALELALRLYSKDEPEVVLKKINDFLFKEQGFAGNKENYYDPDNSFINRLLERKVGIPISLSCLYLFLARRLHLPIYGVGMPGHFLVKYETDNAEIYVDPFNKGKIMTRLDCMRYLLGAGYGFQESFLTRCKPRDILKRMINNLIMIYDQRGMMDHEKQLVRFFEILNSLPSKG